jgi:uncharacterized protein
MIAGGVLGAELENPMWRRPRLLAAAAVLAFAALQMHSSLAKGPKNGSCDAAPTAVDRLVCNDASLAALAVIADKAFEDYQNRAANSAERDARLADQRAWRIGREDACPATAPLSRVAERIAISCLSRIYEQRIAVLSYEQNNAAWPNLRFRPAIVEGAGTPVCDSLKPDLLASFLGPGPIVNLLGEREIGFAVIPALGNDPIVMRADFDPYNRGKPFPVLQWIYRNGGLRPPTIEYRAFSSAEAFLSAIGRGGEPLARFVHEAAHPVIEAGRLPKMTRRLAASKREPAPTIDEMARFFRFNGGIYLLAPVQPVPGKAGSLGVYRLSGPSQFRRLCLFAAHAPSTRHDEDALSSPEVTAFERAAGSLLPTRKLCAAPGDQARTLKDYAVWRPWVLAERRWPRNLSGDQLAVYMRNRALTGPETARQFKVYTAARSAAIDALAPYYRTNFGRNSFDARGIAARYLDQLISDGFQVDPDDESIAGLFAGEYRERHRVQEMALAGNTVALREALGPEPRAVAKGLKGDLEESLVADALEHAETLGMLLDLGFDPDEPGASGRTPLMVAARLDFVEAAKVLLAHGAAVDRGASDAVAQTDIGGNALCMTGDAAVGDTPGRTALSYAAEFAMPDIVRLLLDHGADPAKRDAAGRRPADYVKRRIGAASRSDEITKISAMLN